MRLKLCTVAMALLTLGAAPPPAIEGWWRAPLQHSGDTSEFYLHFDRKGDKLIARFSIPAITADDSPLGTVTVTDDAVKINEADWTLSRSADGQSLTTTIPEALIPHYKIHARFTRSASPQQPQPPRGERPAPAPLWTAAVGEPVIGGLEADPSGRTVFVATKSGRVKALNAATGQAIWSSDLSAPIRATPRFSGGALYVASDAALHKLDARNGRTLWTKPFGKPLQPILEINESKSRWDHYSAAPIVSGSAVYAGSRDGCFYGFTAATGTQTLKACAKDSITATPAVSGNTGYFASFDNHLYAVRLSDGTIRWKADLAAPIVRDIALSNGAVIAGSRTYDLRAFDHRSGAIRWNRYIWFSWIDSSPAVDAHQLVIGSSDAQHIFAMHASTGKALWSTFVGGWAWAKPAIASRTVYAGIVGTSIDYVGKRDSGLAALDRRSGDIKWIFRPPHDPKAVLSGFASDPVIVGKRLIAADLEGNVFAFAVN